MTVRLGLLSTYPATQCGIATFCEALASQLILDGAEIGVVRLVDELEVRRPPVIGEWVAGRVADAEQVAATLDTYDVVVIQHEYGIYGGPDGIDVLEVAARVAAPVVTVLHTVLTTPTPNQHHVLARLLDHSDAVVTMTTTARDRLIAGWDIEPALVSVIPHGARDNRSLAPVSRSTPLSAVGHGPVARPVVLTWGLLSQGKGIEWALHALAELRTRIDVPEYHVVGQTHPRVQETEGEAYRDRLVALTAELGLTDRVVFDGRYLGGTELREVVRRADLILLPYDSLEQVTSGVLAEAVAAGKPVISTSFPHAVELLSGGAGLLVPRRDPSAMAEALERVLTTAGLAASMATISRGLASSLLWPEVSRRYLELADGLLGVRAATVA